MTCFYCYKTIDTQERDGAWVLLLNKQPAHVACCPRPIKEEAAVSSGG